MSTLTTTKMPQIRINATNYLFSPTELLWLGPASAQKNQVVQETDSGKAKILTLSDTEIQIAEFAVNKMRVLDRTVNGITVRGWATLSALIKNSGNMNYRANTCEIWFPGTTKISSADWTARFWADQLFMPIVRVVDGRVWYGDGSQIIRFRKEI